MKKHKHVASILPYFLLLFPFLIANAALAQTEPPASEPAQGEFRIEFNFSNPGARSLGLGGAFVGLADDATAAYANPAGLTNLSRPEISAEGRGWKYTHTYPDHGHGLGNKTNIGVDTVQGIATRESSDSVQGLSFLSFAFPYKRWTFAIYRHELVNYKANITAQGVFFDALSGSGSGLIVPFRVLPSRLTYEASVVNYGASSAYRIGDRFSVGVGLTYYDFSLDSNVRKYNLRTNTLNTNPGDFFGSALFDDSNLFSTTIDKGDSNAASFNAGLLWKVTDNWSLGAVYREGHRFETTRTIISRSGQSSQSRGPDFLVPDAFSIGTAFKPKDQITLTVDVNHIKYADINAAGDPVKVDNVDEIHFGLEYAVLPPQHPSSPISIRLGAWLDPDHQPSFRGLPDVSSGNRRLAVTFLRGKDVWHYSGGIGFVLGERFQLDAAADLSNQNDTFSLSSVYRF